MKLDTRYLNLSPNQAFTQLIMGQPNAPWGAFPNNRPTVEIRDFSANSAYRNIAGQNWNFNGYNNNTNYILALFAKLGYTGLQIPYNLYSILFDRDGLSNRLCTTLPNKCWTPEPFVREIGNKGTIPKTKFEIQLKQIFYKTRFFDNIQRADILANIGQFSALFISYNDGSPTMSQKQKSAIRDNWTYTDFVQQYNMTGRKVDPTTSLEKDYNSAIGNALDEVDWDRLKGKGKDAINYVQPFSQPNAWPSGFSYPINQPSQATVTWYNLCSNGSIFGTDYNQNVSIMLGAVLPTKMNVTDGSRVMHICNGRNYDNNIYAIPLLAPIFNDLISYIIFTGGSSKIFEMNAGGYLSISSKTGDQVQGWEENDLIDIERKIAMLSQSLTRALVLQNGDSKTLNWEQFSPKDGAELCEKRIAAYYDYPWRSLMGTEKGHLSSTQDQRMVQERVEQERERHCTPLLRQFVDNLIDKKIIDSPKNGYEVYYPPLRVENNEEEAKMFSQVVTALAQLFSANSTLSGNYEEAFAQKAADILGIQIEKDDISGVQLPTRDYANTQTNIEDQQDLFENDLQGDGGEK